MRHSWIRMRCQFYWLNEKSESNSIQYYLANCKLWSFLLLSFCIFYTSNSNGTYTPFKAHINFNCLLFHAVYLILFFVRFNCGFFYLAQSLSFFFSSLVRRNWLAFHLMHHLIRAYKFNVHNKPTIQWLYQCFVRNFIYLIKRAMYTFRFLGNQVKF